MKTFIKSVSLFFLSFTLLLGVTSCSKEKGEMSVKMTDAAADDENIKGVFVTVANVYVDGDRVKNFEPKTIEISAYHDGEVYALFSDEIKAENYSEISLEFDYEKDADGNEPGTYVLKSDNSKQKMNASESTVDVAADVTVSEGNTSEIVIDMDLRKSIKRNNDGTYAFVSGSEFTSSFRAVESEKSGKVRGKVQGNTSGDEKVVVYAYRKGTFSSSESQASASSNTRFRGAVTSSEVDASGDYTLAFLEEGNYEIHVVKYQVNSNSQVMFDSEVQVQSLISGLLLSDISVRSNSSVALDLNLL